MKLNFTSPAISVEISAVLRMKNTIKNLMNGLSHCMGRTGKKEKSVTWTVVIMLSAAAAAAKLLQSCPILCNPIDGSPPGSPVPGILQAKTLEFVAISFSNA